MRNDDHPINHLQVSLDIVHCLLDEFEGSVNSKRLKSQITTIGELIRVLWNRDLFYSDANTKSHILKYIKCNEQRDIIQEYIESLVVTKDFNDRQNVYAKIRSSQIDERFSSCAQRSKPAASNILANSHGTSDNFRSQHHEIFNVVCDGIDDWRDFGRCLGIKDAELNRIDYDPNLRKPKSKTYRILEQAEEQFDNRFIEELYSALIAAGRKDILCELDQMDLVKFPK